MINFSIRRSGVTSDPAAQANPTRPACPSTSLTINKISK